MINELNLNYYRPSYIKPFIRQTTDSINDTNKIGDLCGSIWGYYNPFDAANAPIRDKPLDTTIYLWKINAAASAACNACLSITPQSNLEVQVKVNEAAAPVPLAMCFYSLSDVDGGLRKDPKVRLAYNATTWDGWNGKFGGWQNSELFYNINPLKYCLLPTISIFDFSTNSVNTSRTLDNMAAYINSNTDNRRVCLIRSNLYCGDTAPRTISGMYTPASTVGGLDVGILTDRPLCDNLADTVGAWIRDDDHEDYDISKVYNPFNQCMTQLWFDDVNTYQYDVSRQMDIGFYRSATRETFINGRYNVPNSHGKCTAEFCKINFDRKDFDDVSYQWRHCTYYGEVGQEIENGFPLLNYGSANSNIKTLSILEILDTKGLTYGEACKRAVLHELAYYGFWIAETADKAANDPLGTTTTGAGIYLPEKVGGVTTGRYFTGDDIKNVPYAGATDTSPFKYKPEETGSDSGDLTTHTHSGAVVSSARILALDAVDMTLLSKWLNLTYKPDDADLTADFKGVNPADYIVSIRYYPFEVPASTSSVEFSVGGIKVEYNNVGSSVSIMPYEYGEGTRGYYDLGSFVMQPPYCFGDFRDNYIKLQLYIPWCGYVDLDPAVYCQSPDNTYHTISAAIQIDFCTGAAMGLVYRDGLLMETINGTVGVDIPLSAIAQGSYQTAIKQAEIALKQSKISQAGATISAAGAIVGTAAAIATGAPIAAVGIGLLGMANSAKSRASADLSRESAEYKIDHTAPQISNISSASPFNGALSEQAARIFIYKPATLAGADLATYGNTVGFACCKAGKLSDFHGLTVCSNVKLDAIDAPAHHKAAIQQALIKGVYLP